MTVGKPKIWVVCPDYTSGPFPTHESARRHIDRVAKLRACGYPHEIVERIVKPVPATESRAWARDDDYDF